MMFLLVVLLLAGLLAHASSSLHPRFLNLGESVASQGAILQRHPFVFGTWVGDFTSWRSRVLVPYAIEGLSRATGIRFGQSYVLIRFISAAFALSAFAWLVARRLSADYWSAGLAAALLALFLLPTFLHLYEIPSDFPDAGFFALLVLFALERRRTGFVATFFLALLNRESALFAIWVWWMANALPLARRRTASETGFCAALTLAGIGLTAWLRVRFAVEWDHALPAASGAATQPVPLLAVHLRQIREFLAQPYWGNGLYYLAGYLALFCGLIAANWRALPAVLQRLALVAAAIFVCSVPFANLPEMRVYIPAIVIGVFLLMTLLIARLRAAPAAS